MEGASRTAVMMAQFRAAHALVDRDPIFADRFALALAGCSASDVTDFLAANAPDSCAHVVRLFACQRSRFAEEEVERAVGRGVGQYVDLGADLNSFAWRRSDLIAGLAMFEVDHPATQEWKRGRLAAAGLSCPPNLHFAGVDFAAAGALAEQLSAADFDPARASIWSWLGVIQYLPLEAVQATLRAVAGLAAPGSTLVASYGVPDDLMDPASAEFTELTRVFTARIGEPHHAGRAGRYRGGCTRGWLAGREERGSGVVRTLVRRTDRLAEAGAGRIAARRRDGGTVGQPGMPASASRVTPRGVRSWCCQPLQEGARSHVHRAEQAACAALERGAVGQEEPERRR